MKYERMKRNATGRIQFNPADTAKLKKWMAKVDRAIREVRDLAAVNLSRDVPRDFARKFDAISAEAENNLGVLWNLMNDALGLF